MTPSLADYFEYFWRKKKWKTFHLINFDFKCWKHKKSKQMYWIFVAFNSMAHLAFEVWKETVFWMLNIN